MYKACSRSAFSMSQRPTGSERPHDQVAEHGYDEQGHRQRDNKGKQPRNPRLERALQRPDDGDDEERERDRRENRTGEVEAAKNQNGGAEAQHGQCASARHGGLVPLDSRR